MSQEKEQFEIEKIVYIDDELIMRFFKVFSRAEYALKNAGLYKGEKINAFPDWVSFADKIDKKFLALTEENIINARTYLWDNPPKKQKINSDGLFFDDFEIDKEQQKTNALFSMVHVVRNNLFHGGKHTPKTAEVNNTERNQKLLESSIIIIKACMELNDDVKGYYNVQ